MRVTVERKGSAHKAEAERAARAENEERLAAIRQKTAQIMEKKRAEAEAEAKELIADAETRLPEAIRLIVWGIVEKCQ